MTVRMRAPALLAVMALLAVLLVALSPARAEASSHCPSSGGYDNSVSGFVGAGNQPTADKRRLQTYSRNEVQEAHCYNDHWHTVKYYDSVWKWAASAMCAQWQTGGQFHQDWGSAGSWYQCWLEWNITNGYYYQSSADMYTVASKWHLTKQSHWDYDEAFPNDCWRRNSNGTWSESC